MGQVHDFDRRDELLSGAAWAKFITVDVRLSTGVGGDRCFRAESIYMFLRFSFCIELPFFVFLLWTAPSVTRIHRC